MAFYWGGVFASRRAHSKYIQMGEALARVVALRCVSLAEDHDPLSLRLVGDDVWCSVCRVQMPALDVMAHLKGTGSPWWVTGHRRRRHETAPVPPDPPLPGGEWRPGDVPPPDETHAQAFARYVANWSTPAGVVILEDGVSPESAESPESRRVYCETCRAVVMDHAAASTGDLIAAHLAGAAHRYCARELPVIIDWLAERHGVSPTPQTATTPGQKAVVAKVVRNLRARVRAKEALALPPRILLGAPPEGVVDHLQRRFQDGMSWANYGSWHIDHVLPVAAFDATDPLQCLAMCHYTNLQPLWGHQNLAKGHRTRVGDSAPLSCMDPPID